MWACFLASSAARLDWSVANSRTANSSLVSNWTSAVLATSLSAVCLCLFRLVFCRSSLVSLFRLSMRSTRLRSLVAKTFAASDSVKTPFSASNTPTFLLFFLIAAARCCRRNLCCATNASTKRPLGVSDATGLTPTGLSVFSFSFSFGFLEKLSFLPTPTA